MTGEPGGGRRGSEPPGRRADPERPERVRVTSPRTIAPASVRSSIRQEIDESTGVGEIYVRSLVRLQLRAALAVVVALVLTLGSLPLVFGALEDLPAVGRVPLPWIVLGVAVYPWLFALAWWYNRQAERAEREFAFLVGADRGGGS